MSQGELGQLRDLFAAHAVGEDETDMTIRGVFEETGMLVDPHTAVAIAASEHEDLGATPMIVLSTAHPAKFPDAVKRACGHVADQPERLKLKLGQNERCTALPAEFAAVAEFIVSRSNASAASEVEA